jgi:hypothetical protein
MPSSSSPPLYSCLDLSFLTSRFPSLSYPLVVSSSILYWLLSPLSLFLSLSLPMSYSNSSGPFWVGTVLFLLIGIVACLVSSQCNKRGKNPELGSAHSHTTPQHHHITTPTSHTTTHASCHTRLMPRHTQPCHTPPCPTQPPPLFPLSLLSVSLTS